MPTIRNQLKTLMFRLMRPGLRDVNDQLATITNMLRAHGNPSAQTPPETGIWRGKLDGRVIGPDGRDVPGMATKYRPELAYWVDFVKHSAPKTVGGPFDEVVAGWNLGRMKELADFLDLPDHATLQQWSAQRTAVEIGAGPFPSIAMVQWKRAIAVDPLADGYVSEGLVPAVADHVVYLGSPGEHIPLPSDVADIVVIENALDHVTDPGDVLDEIHRLLKPGGLLWVLVDLMDYSDELHPNPFSERSIRDLLGQRGFEVVRDATRDHKSHPEAYGEYRGLLRKPEPMPEVHVTENARQATPA